MQACKTHMDSLASILKACDTAFVTTPPIRKDNGVTRFKRFVPFLMKHCVLLDMICTMCMFHLFMSSLVNEANRLRANILTLQGLTNKWGVACDMLPCYPQWVAISIAIFDQACHMQSLRTQSRKLVFQKPTR